MMHPSTAMKWVSDEIGYGVFATRFIPKGTVVYVRDALEIKVERGSGLLKNPAYSDIINKYSYIDGKGDYILSWDHARYVNHSCNPASITTGYGFEVAIRDIQEGEEITDDYGLLNIEEDFNCACQQPACRGHVRATDFETFGGRWDTMAKDALSHFYLVDQPLLKYLEQPLLQQLTSYLEKNGPYISVQTQKFAEGQENDLLFLMDRKVVVDRMD